ncbi:unnamed protein product [Parascedosporium putredinis]|uniref:Phosphatidylserine synthase n=1 Tax=Parascedosporium putredinis TaxID=1442378 RepID=A0A9P1H270_9PEZI|nr:unnamed protein product [Parascedosporium putredinis]CAI7994642.1 unnamed protein product [Parascedosporium putredinis]
MLRRPGAMASQTNGTVVKDGQAAQPAFDKQKLLLSADAGRFSSSELCISLMPSLYSMVSVALIYLALIFLPFGLFFDFMDGRVARWRKKSSMMGQELDSLADLISFGVAPAAIATALGLRTKLDSCDASGKSHYFEGTPIPTTLGIDAIMAWWVSNDWILENIPFGVWAKGTPLEIHPVVLLFVVHGCLMTSRTIHIPKP